MSTLHHNKLVGLIRLIVPRGLRNAMRRPKVTLSRIKAKLFHLMGGTSSAHIAEGITLKCHPLCNGEFSVFSNDPEQQAEMESFIQTISRGAQFLDIGAHWGVFSLLAMKVGGPSSRAICIEASDQAAKVLRENLCLNEVQDLVSVVNSACGEKVGELRMLTTGAGGADYFVVPADERPDTITVPQVSADSVCEAARFQPTHMKVDVEGFEEEVLRGARRVLSRFKPHLFLELHGDIIHRRGKSPGAVLDLLQEVGYSNWFSVDGGRLLSRQDLAEIGFNARLSIMPPPGTQS
jgi:FkbM family methyltransferase